MSQIPTVEAMSYKGFTIISAGMDVPSIVPSIVSCPPPRLREVIIPKYKINV